MAERWTTSFVADHHIRGTTSRPRVLDTREPPVGSTIALVRPAPIVGSDYGVTRELASGGWGPIGI